MEGKANFCRKRMLYTKGFSGLKEIGVKSLCTEKRTGSFGRKVEKRKIK